MFGVNLRKFFTLVNALRCGGESYMPYIKGLVWKDYMELIAVVLFYDLEFLREALCHPGLHFEDFKKNLKII